MRLFQFMPVVCLALLPVLLGLGAKDALAANGDGDGVQTIARQTDTLDTLFADLKREADPKAARRISEQIWANWRESGSATGNLLMQWTDKAVEARKLGLALDFLDQVIVLMPEYAEAWNRRATIHYLMGNPAKSMADISMVLALEPRHFGALAGMAGILADEGKDALALKAWQELLDIYPANREAQNKLAELAEKLAGDRI